MATGASPSQSQSQSLSPPHPLTMASPPPLQQPQPAPKTGRRIPPPCWSHEDTAALIDSYREKWHSLSRGNLRAAHWQEVADGVAARCPGSALNKTSIQCRHKMEKLRKRYRSELRRSLSTPNRRFSSSWVFFNKIHDMEKTEDDEFDADCGFSNRAAPSSSELGFRSKKFGKLNPNFNHEPPRVIRDGTELGKKVEEGDGLNGMVDAMKMLGEGFVKVERMKMDMAREIEQMRMEMERKRAQMFMESQRRLLEAFIKGIPETGKKVKSVSQPPEFLSTKIDNGVDA